MEARTAGKYCRSDRLSENIDLVSASVVENAKMAIS